MRGTFLLLKEAGEGCLEKRGGGDIFRRGFEFLYLLDAELFRAQDAIKDDLRISKRSGERHEMCKSKMCNRCCYPLQY